MFNKNLDADVAAYNAAPTPPTQDDPDKGYITWGWIGALFFTPLGLVMSIILMTRNRFRQAIPMFVICILWPLFVIAYVVSDDTSTIA